MEIRNKSKKKVCEIDSNGSIVIVFKGNKTILIPNGDGTYKVINQ